MLYATSFDQDVGSWNVSGVSDMTQMFSKADLSTENYDSLLNGWSGHSLQSGVPFGAGSSQYCQGESARNDVLIGQYGWSVSDGGKNCS